MSQMRTKTASTLVVLAYLLGRKSLLDPTTPRRTLVHDPDAKTQGGPFHTTVLDVTMRAALTTTIMNTYLPVHVRALSPKVDTSDRVGLKQVAGLAFANELGNRMTSSR